MSQWLKGPKGLILANGETLPWADGLEHIQPCITCAIKMATRGFVQ